MEGNESAINRVGRAVWTVWGYLSGAVGRYLRPEVRNEEAQNIQIKQEDTVSISKSYKELKVKEQEKERDETKMREDLQYPMVAVRAAAVQWEKKNVAHHSHEEKVKSKHTFADPDAGDRKLQMKKDKEKTLDDKSGSGKTHDGQITEPDDSPANIDAHVKNQDRTFSGSMEDNVNVERNKTNQEQTKKSEEKEKIMQREFDETEEEPIKSVCVDKGLLAEEVDLNERRKRDQEWCEEEEERVNEMIERDNNETEEKSEFIVQAKEAELNVERSESNQKLEEEGIEIMRREKDDTEEELIRCEFIEQGLLAKEADLIVKRSESNQEQRKKQVEEAKTTEELIQCEFINKGLLAKETDLNVGRNENNKELGREEEGEDEIMWRENDVTEEEPIKSEFTEQSLLSKEADLDVERDEDNQEQRGEEEEEGADELMWKENDIAEEEPMKCQFNEQVLLVKDADLDVERDEDNQDQIEESEGVDEIMRRDYQETEEEPMKCQFTEQDLLVKEADLNVERDENYQEQKRNCQEEEEEGVDEIMRKVNDVTEEEPIKSEFTEQGLLSKEAGLDVERGEDNQELRGEEEGVDEIMRRDYEETEEEPMKCQFTEQDLLVKEADLDVERDEDNQEQTGEEEEEGADELVWRENNETEEEPMKCQFTEQDLLVKEADLDVERDEDNQEQREEEEGADEIMRRDYEETEEEPMKCQFTEQDLLVKEADLDVERDEDNQEQTGEEEEEGADELVWRENNETEEEPMKCQFTEQDLLVKEADLDVEKDEDNQEQREEGVGEIMRRANDVTEEEPIKSEFTEQGLLSKEAGLDVERGEDNQELRGEEEGVDEIMRRDYEETEEEPMKCQFTEQDLLVKEADLDVERDEDNQEQREEEESADKLMWRENDETEEEPMKCQFTEQVLLVKEADLDVERDEDNQEQREEEESADKLMWRENDETEEEPMKCQFTEQVLLVKEADLDVERDEDNQEQREEEESADKLMWRKNNETEEEPMKCQFTEQVLLVKEADLDVERDENYQEQGRKQEEEEDDVGEMKSENDETEEEPIKDELIDQLLLSKEADLNVERNESSPDQSWNKESVDDLMILRREIDETEEEPTKGKFIDQGFDPKEQAGVRDLGTTAEVHVTAIEKITDISNKLDNKARKSHMVDEGLFIQPASTWEGRDPLNQSLQMEVEMHVHEQEVIEVCSEETRQEAEGNQKDGHHEGFSTLTVEEQKVFDMEMKKTAKQPEDIDRDVEMTQIENAETYQKVFEPIHRFDDEDNTLAVTIKKQQLEQSTEQKATSEEELNVSDTIHDHDGSQSPVTMTKQDFEAIITQPETGAGNQIETAETTSNVRAEVAAVDVKKSAERETLYHEQPEDKEEVAVQEITGKYFFEKGSLLEDLVSPDTRINEAPFSGIIKSIPLGQVEETVIESLDEMKGSSLQELDECSSEDELNPKAKSSFPDHTAEMLETQMSKQAQPDHEISLVENTCDNSIANETPGEDQINQDKFTEQGLAAEASSHGLSKALYLPEIESEQETLEMQTDSQKYTEEQKRTDEAETGILDEIKGVTTCLGVEEMKAHERKEHTSDLEGFEETSASNINVEVLNDAREWEKELAEEMTGVQTGGEMKETEEPIHQDEGTDKRHLDISESEASKEISQEQDEQVRHGESVVDGKEDIERRGKSGLKRVFEKIAGVNDKDKPSVLTDLLPPSKASSLDFSFQKSKIAVKNPLVRPPKDPRTLINMASVEPLTRPPHPLQTGFVKKSHLEGASLPSKGVIGFKLPGLGSGFPVLRKTETGGKIRDGEDSASATSQKSDSGSQSAEDNVKQETSPHKPKWTPPRQPGMGNPLMMAELKSKLKKPSKE
ncbi:trichohyalin isoform X2 [Tachysurus fulvidraco]|uniref:trichohyalin isoform X2 n=1 Tax=Tachysurus fulvidraco TaxID=1234273 RepID=UPI001FEF8360|nr:trichohyalin isoform X2 [Tachysurus fulvidraco]